MVWIKFEEFGSLTYIMNSVAFVVIIYLFVFPFSRRKEREENKERENKIKRRKEIVVLLNKLFHNNRVIRFQ